MTVELQELDAKLKTILPQQYRECYEDVQPVSMGTAGLKFDAAGRVAWDEIWGSFCDLAMAGGPPHRGTLLEPATPEQAAADPKGFRRVVDEICRGIRMVSSLAVNPGEEGFVELRCSDAGMAGWMTRAINMENVAAVLDGTTVKLPAGPHFRLEKEIKNVITSVAKTAHYYVHHMSQQQKRATAELFALKPLLQPDRNRWKAYECASVREAIWLMRALVVDGVLARREQNVLYVPVDESMDPGGEQVTAAVSKVKRLFHENS